MTSRHCVAWKSCAARGVSYAGRDHHKKAVVPIEVLTFFSTSCVRYAGRVSNGDYLSLNSWWALLLCSESPA